MLLTIVIKHLRKKAKVHYQIMMSTAKEKVYR